MINTVFEDKKQGFKWIDVVMPTEDDYKQLLEEYNLHPASVKDCLAPNHLPKYERIGNTIFMITRVYDVNSSQDADDVQKLTNKIAIFVEDNFLITIHRREEPFLTALQEKWATLFQEREYTPIYVINQLLYKIIHTFDSALNNSTEQLDVHEKEIFMGTKDPRLIKEMYLVKRRASVFKRMLFLTKDTLDQYERDSSRDDPFTHDLKENAESLFFIADELHENVSNLLNLHISLSSHRTNEVMGVLTIFSVFFLPLTFIVGLYGMNFRYMPELQAEYGYPGVIFIMLLMVIVTYVWFKRKNWL